MHSFNLIFVDMVTMYEISNKNVACTFGFKCLYCVVHYFQRNVDHIFIEASDKPFPPKKTSQFRGSQILFNPCPRTFRPRTRLIKANKGQRRSTMHNILRHHTQQYVKLLFQAYNRFHWSEYTWQVTQRQPRYKYNI